jgi:uncharacterized membrane protein
MAMPGLLFSMNGVSEPAHVHRLNPWHFVFLGLILILATILRAYHIGVPAMSVDELGSLEIATGRGQVHLTLPRGVLLPAFPDATSLREAEPIWKIPLALSSDVHPPLYFVCLRLWMDVFGDGDSAARALSALAGVIGVLLIFDVGRWLQAPMAGIWAALLMAVAQPAIAMSQQARPYGMAVAFFLLAVDAYLRVEKLGFDRRRRNLLLVALTAACLTHYFVIPGIAALGVSWRLKSPSRAGILCVVGVSVLILWGWGIWIQIHNFTNPWMYWFAEDAEHHSLATLARVCALPFRHLADPPSSSNVAGMAAVLYILPFLLVRRKPELLFPGLLLIASVGLIAGLDLFRGTRQLIWVKYTFLAGPAIYLILAMLLRGGWLPMLATLACLAGFPQAYQVESGDFKPMAAKLDRLAGPNDPILFFGGGSGDWYAGGLCLEMQRYCRQRHVSVAILNQPASTKLLNEIGPHFWLIAGEANASPAWLLPGRSARAVDHFPDTAIIYEIAP